LAQVVIPEGGNTARGVWQLSLFDAGGSLLIAQAVPKDVGTVGTATWMRWADVSDGVVEPLEERERERVQRRR
jgi:hypothetical protein